MSIEFCSFVVNFLCVCGDQVRMRTANVGCVQKKWVDLAQIHPLFVLSDANENGVVLLGTNALHGAYPGTNSFTCKFKFSENCEHTVISRFFLVLGISVGDHIRDAGEGLLSGPDARCSLRDGRCTKSIQYCANSCI